MKTEEKTVDFDLSTLTLSELVSLYENVANFTRFLKDQKKETESKEDAKNE